MAQEFWDPNIGRICINLLGMIRGVRCKKKLLRVYFFVHSSGWLASYVGQLEEVPASTTTVFFFFGW